MVAPRPVGCCLHPLVLACSPACCCLPAPHRQEQLLCGHLPGQALNSWMTGTALQSCSSATEYAHRT